MIDHAASTPRHSESSAYKGYALAVFTFAYMLCVADRAVLGILQEPVKHEFGLSDLQLGLLGGPAFAILYALCGIPVARLADRTNRKITLSVCIALWSVMTAVCGAATSYGHLFLARMGIAIGEAGCTPSSTSMISDTFAPERRASAISAYTLGSPLGGLLAAIGGGWISTHYGWRSAFLALGVAGVFFAILILLTVKEPRRPERAPFAGLAKTARFLFAKPAYRHMVFGSSLAGFVGYGVNHYLTSFLIRSHNLSLLQGAGIVGIVLGICGGIGALSSGYLADRLVARMPNALMVIPVIGLACATPLYIIAFSASQLWVAAGAVMLGTMFHTVYMTATYAGSQGIAPPHMRATAVALALLVINMVGFGLGPPLVGWLSDTIAAMNLASAGMASGICAKLPANATCAHGIEEGLRIALMVASTAQMWGALHFLLASRSLVRDWEG